MSCSAATAKSTDYLSRTSKSWIAITRRLHRKNKLLKKSLTNWNETIRCCKGRTYSLTGSSRTYVINIAVKSRTTSEKSQISRRKTRC